MRLLALKASTVSNLGTVTYILLGEEGCADQRGIALDERWPPGRRQRVLLALPIKQEVHNGGEVQNNIMSQIGSYVWR